MFEPTQPNSDAACDGETSCGIAAGSRGMAQWTWSLAAQDIVARRLFALSRNRFSRNLDDEEWILSLIQLRSLIASDLWP